MHVISCLYYIKMKILSNHNLTRESSPHWEAYKSARNHANSLVRRAKKHHFKTALDDNLSKPKLLWKNLEKLNVHNKSPFASNAASKFSADDLNDQFSKVFNSAPKPSSIASDPICNTSDMSGIEPFVLSAVSESDVRKIMLNINTNAAGLDEINLAMIKKSSTKIVTPI